MKSILESVARKFVASEHIKNILDGAWTSLYDETGKELQGIRGRMGAAAVCSDGVEIGVDYIEMQPGAQFPLHVHPGDHILYIIEGPGMVHINGIDHSVKSGDTVFIPAEYPHGVKTTSSHHLIFLAFGHPHKHLSATDRMTYASEEANDGHSHSHPHTHTHHEERHGKDEKEKVRLYYHI